MAAKVETTRTPASTAAAAGTNRAGVTLTVELSGLRHLAGAAVRDCDLFPAEADPDER
jgi:hypothetical protein